MPNLQAELLALQYGLQGCLLRDYRNLEIELDSKLACDIVLRKAQ